MCARRRHHRQQGDALGVPQGGTRQVAHGVYGSSEHVVPQEFALREGFVELSKQFLCSRGGMRGDEAGKGLVRARVVFRHDQLTRRSTRRANMMNRRGHHGARHDSAGHKGRQSHADDRAETSQLMRM